MRTLVYIIFSLCMLTALHSCNDNQVDVTKTPEELYEDSLDLRFEQMDRDQLIYNLCTIDSSANGKVSYIPRHGKVLNEGTPTTRYIGVETLEEAMNYFKTSIALPPQEEDADNCTAVPKKMLISFLIVCFSVSYEDISMRRILKWMYCANFAQTFKMSQYVPNSLRVQSVVTIHR